MDVAQTAVAVRARTRDEAALTLLRADNLPAIAAVLGAHFTRERRVLPVTDFLVALEDDLARLREAGFDLPQDATDYLTEWTSQRHWLVRRPTADGQETVELSVGAATALSYLDESQRPRFGLTSSRLGNITEQVGRLARDTDPDQGRRIAGLVAERDALQARIDRAEAEGLEPLDDRTARERLQEVLALVVDLPRDFAQVSADVDQLNRDLRERIIRSHGSSAEVLTTTFEGVDAVSESDAGRTFAAFQAILLDPQRGEAFDDAVEEVLSRPFAREVPAAQRRQLEELLPDLQRESLQVRDTMTALSRSLRQFVNSRAWADQQRLDEAIVEAQGVLLDLVRRRNPRQPSGVVLDLPSLPVDSVAARRPYSPRAMHASVDLSDARTGEVDLEALRERVRESEIDVEELVGLVADDLATRDETTVGDVITRHGASQGLASVVGLLLLARRHGHVEVDTETLRWTSHGGTVRSAEVARHVFTKLPHTPETEEAPR